jgi:hypothetical protein
MGFWKTIVVVILLVIVGGFALYLGHQPAPEKTPKLFRIASKDIRQIELRSPIRDIVVERAKGDAWKIVKPIDADADRIAVDGIADAVSKLEITGTAEEKPTDLAPFGLANPVVTVTITSKDKRAFPAILVGKDTPVGNSAYIKATDKPAVLLVANVFPTQVNKTVDDLRSRILVALKPEDVSRVAFNHGEGGATLEIERKGDNWTIVKPKRYPADKAAVQEVLDTITSAHVADFIDDNPSDLAKYGLVDPSLSVELYGGKTNARESMLFGFKQPEVSKSAVYVRRGEGNDRPIATVADNVFIAANKTFSDLRDKTVLAFDPPKVERVKLLGGPIDETLQRAPGGKWNVTGAGKTVPAEVPVVESLLDQLHGLKATKIPEDPMSDPQRYGMVNPNLAITLYSKDGSEVGTVRVSSIQATIVRKDANEKPASQNFGYATTSRDSAVFEILPQLVTDLENTAARLHTDVVGTPAPPPTKAPSPGAPSPSPSAARQ